MRKVTLLVVIALLSSATFAAGKYRFELVAKTGDLVGDQVIAAAVYPSVSGDSIAYRVHNVKTTYIVKDGAIVVRTGDQTLDKQKITDLGRAAISGSHLAYIATVEGGVSGIVLDGKFAVKGGDVIDGKKIGRVVDFALTGNRLAVTATDFSDESRVWLFFDGRYVEEVAGKAAALDCILAYPTSLSGRTQIVMNGEVVATTRGPDTDDPPPSFADGLELTWVSQPAFGGDSFAFVARSEPAHVYPFIVMDGHIIAKNGDTIDGIEITAASEPALNEDGSRIAFKATYTDPVSKKSCQGVVFGGVEDVAGVAQFALGEGLSTSLTIVNNGRAPVSGSIAFVHQDGSPWSVQTGSLSESTIPFDLAPGASKQVAGQASGALTVGHATITTQGGSVDCFSSFVMTQGSTLLTTATVLGHAPGTVLSLPAQKDEESQTGIAISNPSLDPVKVRLSLRNRNGTIVKSTIPAILNPLRVGGQVAAFLNELFSDVKQFEGTLRIEVEGPGEVVATGMIVRQALLSAVPVTRLNR
ncbi:MAG: hypothetical protein EHM18_18390 [Acidobacteria bacterium]|nr:MAG: hypothetical protein EHJ95_08175 [Euryarchaeota archaeon]RPJ80511.1 MAG: hypothetical protein EHM18_18390 [Acidobacteriota bacterium]